MMPGSADPDIQGLHIAERRKLESDHEGAASHIAISPIMEAALEAREPGGSL
eukprot:CAMPEP_0115189864 /NCGR_PEP_ID=MMETSP0270-20121206/11733_1 /TAXON_ID=71861 /ORGANISM="Scrippsiella trochoidea, Strain CCMP3099" /LENGTH=51 /DNA_ID=CAMNT_0002603065 /DNA_START=234 /DNA_END=389 /DNA_ORIENTATION=+